MSHAQWPLSTLVRYNTAAFSFTLTSLHLQNCSGIGLEMSTSSFSFTLTQHYCVIDLEMSTTSFSFTLAQHYCLIGWCKSVRCWSRTLQSSDLSCHTAADEWKMLIVKVLELCSYSSIQSVNYQHCCSVTLLYCLLVPALISWGDVCVCHDRCSC